MPPNRIILPLGIFLIAFSILSILATDGSLESHKFLNDNKPLA